MLSGIGELLFTVVVSYMGAIELFFMAKQLYHLVFQHQHRQMLLADDRDLKQLQDQIESEIVEAAGKEILGFNAMKDGVLYKDGIRIDPNEINDIDKVLQKEQQQQRKMMIGKDKDQETSSNNGIKVTQELTAESEPIEIHEEPCIKKNVERLSSGRSHDTEEALLAADDKRTNLSQSIKTQFGQTSIEGHAQPSLETAAPKKSPSPSVQITPSSDVISPLAPEMRFEEYHREAPDGQDFPEPQYSDDYLRSLDGIKIRPLVRDDGSGRRRAFKKRRSGSSSSQESRASREEELKMFTSLEEEEFESIRRGDSDYVQIRYSSDPNLIKADKHHRRHKKSPIKDSHRIETESSRSSLEQLHEEHVSPWGDVKPEHYKDSEFWKREKTLSIEEENEESAQSWKDDVLKQQAGQITALPTPIKNLPKSSSFEVATPSQHKEAVSAMKKERAQDEGKTSKNTEDMENVSSNLKISAFETELTASCNQKTSNEIEESACTKRDDQTTSLRRSPRQEDLDRYEERLLQKEKPQREQEEQTENAKLHALSPSAKISPAKDNKNFSTTSTLTDNESEITIVNSPSASPAINIDTLQKELHSPQGTSNRTDAISSSLGIEESMCGKFDRSKTPVVEIVPPPQSNDATNNSNTNLSQLFNDRAAESTILEGISDFYDFNASINPSRSPSVERAASPCRKSRSPFRTERSPVRLSKSPSKPPISPSRLSPSSSKLQPFDQYASDSETLSRQKFASGKIESGISNFYDFCVIMNQHVYGHKRYRRNRATTPRSATDYLARKMQIENSKSKSPSPGSMLKIPTKNEFERKSSSPTIEQPKINLRSKSPSSPTTEQQQSRSKQTSKSPSPSVNLPKNELMSLQNEGGGTKSKHKVDFGGGGYGNDGAFGYTPIDTPETPEFQRSFSANMRYVESMREEYRQNMYKRSRYVGESMDFENDFEELREKTRHFKRSHSKSRTPPPILQDNFECDPCTSRKAAEIAARQELQDRILAEITKTTINYQDFSRDANQKFIDFERRGSDSALLQKPEIMIQIEDDRKRDEGHTFGGGEYQYDDNYDFINELEAEEYHHFRRFSLNQEDQIDNDYIYLEQVAIHHSQSDSATDWAQQEQFHRNSTSSCLTSFETVDVTGNESDHAEADDVDTESEDDRQTVVEVDDEIDEDVWDYERSEEFTNNEQSECEEAEREMDRYANKNAADWNIEEGAVGGIEDHNENNIENLENLETIKTFDIMYKNALENTEESGIQKDYEQIVNEISRETNEDENTKMFSSVSDAASIKTEDLLDEILREDEEKYKHYRFPKRSSKIKDETQNFIEQEVEWSTTAPVSKEAKLVSIKSTRLRSRYGLAPPPIHRNFDDIIIDDVDLNYKPKKEYKWRKNFKLDDDELEESKNSSEIPVNGFEEENHEEITINDEMTFFTKDAPNAKNNSPHRFENNAESNFKPNRFLENDENKEFDEGRVLQECKENVFDSNEKHKEKLKNFEERKRANSNQEMDTHPTNENNEKLKEKKKKLKRKSRKASKGNIAEDVESLQFSEQQNENLPEMTSESGTKKKAKKKKRSLDITSPPDIDEMKITLNGIDSEKLSKFPSLPEKTLDDSNPPCTKLETSTTSFSCLTPTPNTSNPSTESSETRSQSPSVQVEGSIEPKSEPNTVKQATITSPKPPVPERTDSTGVYDLIKDGSMYPWF